MKNARLFFLFIAGQFLNCPISRAVPEHLEVWFLSPTSKQNQVYQKNEYLLWTEELRSPPSTLLVLNTLERQCQKVGEYCFDPQVGLYEEKSGRRVVPDAELDPVPYDNFPKIERSRPKMIYCDRDHYFDLYCGKGKQGQKKAPKEVEVLIDTSSTMKEVDDSSGGSCFRKMAFESLKKKCSGQLSAYRFDERIYPSSASPSAFCLTSGLNNSERLIKKIRQSRAKSLLVITDIYENSVGVVSQIKEMGGEIKGSGTLKDLIFASNLPKLIGQFSRVCQ